MSLNKNSKIYVAGHNGMVGSSIVRLLKSQGFSNIIMRSSKDLDLTNQQAVQLFFEYERPQYVFLAAAKVGGILANNTYPGSFIYDNVMIEYNVIHSSYLSKVKKLLFFGSSCIYPKHAEQPISEDSLLSGYLEATNEAYAIAKISGIKLCQAYATQYDCNFISVMPTNLYGPNDNYDLNKSHVLPALLRKFHEAKVNNEDYVTVWGSGKPMREFLHVDDLAEASLYLMENYDKSEILNIGTGKDLSIYDLALKIKSVVGYEGKIRLDESKPDGTFRKLLDVTKVNSIGWNYKITLDDGIKSVYSDLLKSKTFNIR